MATTQRRALGMVLTALVVLAGCGTGFGSIPRDEPEVQLLTSKAPVTEPTWGTEHNALYGFVSDGRRALVRIDTATGETVAARGARGAGENVGVIPQPFERLALPLPGADRVAVLDSETLEEVDSIDAGADPSWVAVHPTSQSLFALSAGGDSVTAVDIETEEITSRHGVAAGPAAVVKPGNDAADPAFWVVTPEGFINVSGEPPERRVARTVPVNRHTFSPDDDSERSAYYAEAGSSQVVLVEGGPGDTRRVAASTGLGATIEHVEANPEEEYRVYAVTADRLYELAFDTLEISHSTEFRTTLREAGLGDAKVSGIAVGDDYVYLAVEGEPRLLKIRKSSPPSE